MARNPEIERQTATDLITVLLQERLRRQSSGTFHPSVERQIRRVISHVLLWNHSQANGDKYNGCHYWSEGALQSRLRHGKVNTNHRQVEGDALRHEHLFPRKQLITKLFSLSDPTPSEVLTILDCLNIAVIITKSEDALLPNEGDETAPWERYRKAGIKWKDTAEIIRNHDD